MRPCLNSFRRGRHFRVLLNPRGGLHLTIALPERMEKNSEAATRTYKDHLFKRFSGNKDCKYPKLNLIASVDGRNPDPVEHNGTMFIQCGTGFLSTTHIAG